jgi:hypothetical protein
MSVDLLPSDGDTSATGNNVPDIAVREDRRFLFARTLGDMQDWNILDY